MGLAGGFYQIRQKAAALTALFLIGLFGSSQVAFARGGSNEQGLIRSLCVELLTNPNIAKSVEVEGAPGLRILYSELYGLKPNYGVLSRADTGAFHQHELVSSARYARYIQSEKGENLLMVPGIDHQDVPGFDGVILDSQGQPVANYSLKSIIEARSKHAVLDRADRGVEKAKRFSFIEQWLLMFRLLVKDESGAISLNPDQDTKKISYNRSWLNRSLPIFGIESPGAPKRPTRVVIDIQTEAQLPDERDISTMRQWVRESQGLIESIVVMKDGTILEIK